MALVDLKVFNAIEAVTGPYKYRARLPEVTNRVVVHRTGVSHSVLGIAQFYRDNPQYTGGKFPYHFVIYDSGKIIQCVELGYVAPGAFKLNRTGIQVACHGDFRYKPPTPKQGLALIELCVLLCEWVGDVRITGHTEVKGTSADADKVCPGAHLPMDNLRRLVEEQFRVVSPLLAEKYLLKAGVTI
jgi:hypothetical protein